MSVYNQLKGVSPQKDLLAVQIDYDKMSLPRHSLRPFSFVAGEEFIFITFVDDLHVFYSVPYFGRVQKGLHHLTSTVLHANTDRQTKRQTCPA